MTSSNEERAISASNSEEPNASNDSGAIDDHSPGLGPEINQFISHVESISDGFMVGMIMALQILRESKAEELEKFEADFCKIEIKDGKRSVSVPGEKYLEYKQLSKRLHLITIALVNLPRSLLVSLVSYFDAYVGRVIRTIYLRRPELLNNSDRKLTFEELVRFSSIESVREYIIEKEVESVLRSSHSEHFRWMEKIYDVPLTKGLDSWQQFIELTERRNLFVHTDGVVSSQYISVCTQQGCELEGGVKEGEKLGVPQKYFNTANDCVYEIGVKLGHVLWRKQFPAEREQADNHLVQLTFDLLVAQRYALAANVLDFACDGIKKYSSEIHKLMLIVNRALAYKWMGNQKSAKHSLKGVDWSAKSDEFRLANAVILDDWSAASTLMKKMGASDRIGKLEYRSWPLFKEWRKRGEFKQAYSEIFNEDFDVAIEVDGASDSDEDSAQAELESLDLDHAVTQMTHKVKEEIGKMIEAKRLPTS